MPTNSLHACTQTFGAAALCLFLGDFTQVSDRWGGQWGLVVRHGYQRGRGGGGGALIFS
jgi:hypothetical protein